MAGNDLRYGGPASWNITGPAGGPFTNARLDAKLGNRSNQSLTWTASSVPSFVRLSAMNGTLGGHVRFPIGGDLDPSTTTLAAGNYGGNIVFHNQTTSEADVVIPCVLTVQAATVNCQLNPLTDFSSQGPASGPFQPDSQVYTLTNTGTGTLSWQVHSSDAWLSPAPTSGQLAPGASIGVNLSITDPATATLSNGLHQAVVEWRNAADNSVLHSRNVNLNIMAGSSSAGWTQFTPSVDTRTIYVSNSTGNDANDGLSQNTPKRTIAGGKSLVRTGYPDWLLLRKGDTWSESFGNWGASGRSATEPLLVSSYGTSTVRPLLLTGNSSGFTSGFWPGPLHDVAVVGIHFHCNAYDGSSPTKGFECMNGGARMLIEDCVCEGYNNGMVIMGGGSARQVNISVRRNLIIDSYDVTGAGANGLFLADSDGALVEENLLDNNGWTTAHPHAGAPGHNVYVQNGSTGIVFRGNIVSRTDGIQMRPGGVCENNLFLKNALSLQFGSGVTPEPNGITGTVTRNVVLDGNDYDPNNPSWNRGWGLILGNMVNASVTYNIVANNVSGHSPIPVVLNFDNGHGNPQGMQNVTFDHNIVYGWGGTGRGAQLASYQTNILRNITLTNNDIQNTIDSTFLADLMSTTNVLSEIHSSHNRWFRASGNPGQMFQAGGVDMSFSTLSSAIGDSSSTYGASTYPDPTRTIGTYQSSIGGQATIDAFIAGARNQSKSNWLPIYTADAVNNYIRAGFGL